MIDRDFGTNIHFEAGSKTTAAEDAAAILASCDAIIEQAAWEEYIAIKLRDEQYDDDVPPGIRCRAALEAVVRHKGNFKAFNGSDKPLLGALLDDYLLFYDVQHVLMDHHLDMEAAEELFARFPELHQLVPKDYDDTKHIVKVVVEVIHDYQWQLERFAEKHRTAIEKAMK